MQGINALQVKQTLQRCHLAGHSAIAGIIQRHSFEQESQTAVIPQREVRCHAQAQEQRSTDASPATTTVAAPFHLAFPVRDIDEARDFYGG